MRSTRHAAGHRSAGQGHSSYPPSVPSLNGRFAGSRPPEVRFYVPPGIAHDVHFHDSAPEVIAVLAGREGIHVAPAEDDPRTFFALADDEEAGSGCRAARRIVKNVDIGDE